ncbi:hypothetical protein ACTA71_000869 [Dictyostelium dimigraforme]
MKYYKSLLLLIVTIITGSNAYEASIYFNISNPVVGIKCGSQTLTYLMVTQNSCVPCLNGFKISPVINSTNKFTFNTYSDFYCQTKANQIEFKCNEKGKSSLSLGDTTYPIICIDPSYSSSPKIVYNTTLLALVLLFLIAL